jgi:hypothetical protein
VSTTSTFPQSEIKFPVTDDTPNLRLESSQPEIDMENGAGDAKDPSGFLSEILGASVTVKLNSGVIYKGTLPFSLKVEQSFRY